MVAPNTAEHPGVEAQLTPGRAFARAAMGALGVNPAQPPWGTCARIARILDISESVYARGCAAMDSRDARARILAWIDAWNSSPRATGKLLYTHGPGVGAFEVHYVVLVILT